VTAVVGTWTDLPVDRAMTKPDAGLSQAAQDEIVLLRRIRDGSGDEFAEIIRRHQSRVFAILSRYERDAQLVEDLAQETFLKAWRGLKQFDGRAPFEHWLSRIAVHVAIDHIRARRDREVRFSDLGDDAQEWLQNLHPSGPEPRAAREILDLAMQKLSAEDRLVLTMLEIEEYSVKEICARTGWTSIMTRVRAFRARAKLKEALLELEESVTEKFRSRK
jgi:RNA polymerase sigma-70 factor (ECF subfamily)